MPALFTKDLLRLNEWEFEFQQRSEQPLLLSDLYCRALAKHFSEGTGLPPVSYDYVFTDTSKGYSRPAQKSAILRDLRELIADPAALERILTSSIAIPQRFGETADAVQAALQNAAITNEALAAHWECMDADFIRVIPWFWYPYYISTENLLTDRVAQGLARHRAAIEPIVDLDEALLLLVFSVKKTGFQKEQAAMYELASIAETDESFSVAPAFVEAAHAYLRTYDWLTTFLLTPLLPMTYAQLVERVREAVKVKFTETYRLQQAANAAQARTASIIIGLIGDDHELLDDIARARELGYTLTAGVEEGYKACAKYLALMQLVASRIGVRYEDIKYLLSAEIVSALRSGEVIPPTLAEERRAGYIMATLGGECYLATGSEGHALTQWVDRELNKVDETISELKGQVACKGSARAAVRVALEPAEAHLLTEGEILVCPMTNPDYVPAMKRASAIITDEGGLLSHAAIMSREFGKPCIIATKIATKVLKTGDLVEVDATRGIITILR